MIDMPKLRTTNTKCSKLQTKPLIPRKNPPRLTVRGMNANCFLLGREPRPLGRRVPLFGIGILVFGIVCNLCIVCWNLAYAYARDNKEEETLFIAKKAFEDGFYEASIGLAERLLNNYPDSP